MNNFADIIISRIVSAGNISQQFFHAFNSFFRCGNSDLLAKSKHPSIKSITQRNGDGHSGVSLIVVRDQDVAAKSIDDRIHDVIDEDKSDTLYFAAMHGEGIVAVVVNVDNSFKFFLSLSFRKNNTSVSMPTRLPKEQPKTSRKKSPPPSRTKSRSSYPAIRLKSRLTSRVVCTSPIIYVNKTRRVVSLMLNSYFQYFCVFSVLIWLFSMLF